MNAKKGPARHKKEMLRDAVEPMDKMSEKIVDLIPNQFAAVEREFVDAFAPFLAYLFFSFFDLVQWILKRSSFEKRSAFRLKYRALCSTSRTLAASHCSISPTIPDLCPASPTFTPALCSTSSTSTPGLCSSSSTSTVTP
ncbi:hypothetical protein PoB_004895100 [Plakobranchus ocellatus]|uniref:Uncharacterized protein n=1 Tax=Plakobranchus ocellatus TaxID=259542 RepID=A0AAV4BPR0_9GAST|nr:hypothetical protein PoB_004895100 [Plakobranchus ocellatus]